MIKVMHVDNVQLYLKFLFLHFHFFGYMLHVHVIQKNYSFVSFRLFLYSYDLLDLCKRVLHLLNLPNLRFALGIRELGPS